MRAALAIAILACADAVPAAHPTCDGASEVWSLPPGWTDGVYAIHSMPDRWGANGGTVILVDACEAGDCGQELLHLAADSSLAAWVYSEAFDRWREKRGAP